MARAAIEFYLISMFIYLLFVLCFKVAKASKDTRSEREINTLNYIDY